MIETSPKLVAAQQAKLSGSERLITVRNPSTRCSRAGDLRRQRIVRRPACALRADGSRLVRNGRSASRMAGSSAAARSGTPFRRDAPTGGRRGGGGIAAPYDAAFRPTFSEIRRRASRHRLRTATQTQLGETPAGDEEPRLRRSAGKPGEVSTDAHVDFGGARARRPLHRRARCMAR